MASIQSLIADEGWSIVKTKVKNQEVYKVKTPYDDTFGLMPVKHPALLHLDIYRKHTSAETRYQHLKKAHDYFWPDTLWHQWTEDRFRAFTEDWSTISLAAGAEAAKSYDVAKYCILFWYSNPTERTVVVASVTLDSLLTRVWGYLTNHIKDMALQLPYKYFRSNPPKILYETESVGRNKIEDDTIHGIFAVAARNGNDTTAISTWIGKHPKDKILIILDEATDMPMSILTAKPNLDAHPEKFQMIDIGNSNSTNDLHGVLSTPKNGWDSVDITLSSWETVQPRGICLYFSPYESPAIRHPDPQMREKLSHFLIDEKTLALKEVELGKDTEAFYRFVLGFWKSKDTESTLVTKKFLHDFNPAIKPEWSGYYPVQRVAGFDFAISTGGDKVILKVANVGHSYDLKVKIDFMNGAMQYAIPLKAIHDKSVELQMADQVIDHLYLLKVKIENLAVDCTGQGRAIATVIELRNKERGFPLGPGCPMKVYTVGQHNKSKKKEAIPDLHIQSSHELWNLMHEYILQGQVTQLDETTITQITNRLVLTLPNGKQKLESKKEYKRRMAAIGMGHSPDEADATALCFQALKYRIGILPGTSWPVPKDIADEHLKKLFAHRLNSDKSSVSGETVIEADFSGDLLSYVQNKRPF